MECEYFVIKNIKIKRSKWKLQLKIPCWHDNRVKILIIQTL